MMRGGRGRLCEMEGALERGNETGNCPAGGDERYFPTRFVTVKFWACIDVTNMPATTIAKTRIQGGELFLAFIIGNNNPQGLRLPWGFHLTAFALKIENHVLFSVSLSRIQAVEKPWWRARVRGVHAASMCERPAVTAPQTVIHLEAA